MQLEIIKNIVESLLFVSEQPLSIDQLMLLFDEGSVSKADIRVALDELENDYQARGIELKQVASGFRFQACADYQLWFHRLLQEKPQRYSKALLETLAIIAYRQPVTRADIEGIRGVAVSSSIIKTLVEREWVRVVGHRDVPGKPSIYATTKAFLDYFGLISLNDLPPLSELKDLNEIMKRGDDTIDNPPIKREIMDETEISDDVNTESTEETIDEHALEEQMSHLKAKPIRESQASSDPDTLFEEDFIENE